MPPGADGTYFFSLYVLVDVGEWGRFDIILNDERTCTILPDENHGGVDYPMGACSAVIVVVAGNVFLINFDKN